MRRKDREIKDKKTLETIFAKAEVCRIAFMDKDYPYVVPMNFGYKDNCLYFHSAPEGHKIDLIKKNNKVAFEISLYRGPVSRGAPCGWDFSYRCIMGTGRMFIIKDPKLKRKAIDILIKHYSKKKYRLLPKAAKGMIMLRLEIKNMSGKGNKPRSL